MVTAPGGFEPPAFLLGKSAKALLPVFESWAVTIKIIVLLGIAIKEW
jgi:hypothetical protein